MSSVTSASNKVKVTVATKNKVGKVTEESTALAQQYQQKTDKQHILENPDTYIGSVENVDANLWVLPEDSNGRIVLKQIEYIPGLYKLFDEGIVNARDHVIRMIQKISSNSVPDHRAVSYIETTIDDDGTITFANDGNGIDVAKHPEYDLWIPEMIFGHLRTSTNYNTDEKRIVGGKNGFGFKLVLIWSTYGKIETVDHVRGLKYTQEFHNNLDTIDPPTIKAAKSTKPYTRVSFKPDYTRFGMPGGLTPDMLALFRKRICDIAAVTDHSIKKIKVSLNGMAMPVHNFQQYIDLYIGKIRGQGTNSVKGKVEADDVSVVSNGTSVGQGTEAVGQGTVGQGTASAKRVYEEASERWEYAVALSPTHQFEQISFVNGICTHKGGKHVDYILGQITRKVAAYIEKKKKITVNTNTIKEQLMLFLRCDIENPAFDSQTKDFMNTPSNKFGSSCVISDAFIEKVAKMGVMDAACSLTEIKERGIAARKTDGVKTRTVRGIANFIDANHAGTAQSKDCVLILCEGLSAMSGVVSGLSSTDRNQYGIYPLKGKLLNVRGENIKKISENKEITDLKKILGLETGREYASAEDVHKHLRYGKVMILCDQDVDGSHIKALCVNLFQSEWASLFRISGFLAFMNTPILRAKKGAQSHVFYNEGEYETWKAQPGHATGWTIKYFKGLGTSTSAEFKEYFANKKIVDFTYQKLISDETVDKVFNKKRADERKTWLENYDKDIHLDTTHSMVKYEDFVNKELIHFSVYDCERSIPNLVDGLKTSLRKILYCAFKRRLTTEVKVAQFSGYVSEHSEYHHGEASLNGAIVGMAQNYMGSNNINLLLPNGQFGTRMMGGDDSASERYIFTQLNALTRALFPDQDDPILHYLNEDGTMIEPEYYVPILPMVLVNGISGIGTGFSSSIPPFHPMRIVDYLRHKMNGIGSKPDIQFVPYYENFKGVVAAVPDETNKYSIKGVYEKIGEDQIRITELPVGTWTMPYLTFLEGLVDGGVDKQGKKIAPTIKDFVSNSTEKFVDIQVTFQKGRLAELESGVAGGVEKVLKLATTVSTTNMHLFDAQCKLHKYGSVEEIIDAFCLVRLDTYAKRKAHQMADMERILVKLTNKARYIQCALDGSIDLRHKTSDEIDALLLSKKLVKIDESYDYLIKMPMVSVSKENVAKLMKEKGDTEAELATLRATTIEQMWLRELATFEEQYGIYVNKRAQEYLTKSETGPKTVLKKKAVSAKK
jgi:DNA topoisomerase-2